MNNNKYIFAFIYKLKAQMITEGKLEGCLLALRNKSISQNLTMDLSKVFNSKDSNESLKFQHYLEFFFLWKLIPLL